MYTLRITDDNAVISTRCTLMEKSNCVDEIQIAVNKLYKNQLDMSEYTVRMEYVLPISHKIRNTILEVSKVDEDKGVIYYNIPVTVHIDSEPGDIEVSFTFYRLEHDDESNKDISYVRKTMPGIIHITPLAQFENYEPSEMFTEIDQRILAMEAKQKDLQAISQAVYNNMPTDIRLNIDNNKLTLTNADGDTGIGVGIPDLSDSIAKELIGVDPDGKQDGVVDLDNVPNAQSIDRLLK